MRELSIDPARIDVVTRIHSRERGELNHMIEAVMLDRDALAKVRRQLAKLQVGAPGNSPEEQSRLTAEIATLTKKVHLGEASIERCQARVKAASKLRRRCSDWLGGMLS